LNSFEYLNNVSISSFNNLVMIKNALCYVKWDFDPIVFKFSVFSHEYPIGFYGLLFALAFVVGNWVMGYIFKKEGKPQEDLEKLTTHMVLGTVIGARLGHYLFYEWERLFSDPLTWLVDMITPPYAGLASHGATVGIIFAIYLYSRKRPDQPILWVLDRVVIVVGFSGFIRIGNLLNSEIYGTPTDLPWGFMFMAESDPNLLPIVPRHPTQIYEFLFCMLLVIITFWMWKMKKNSVSDGIIFCTFTILLFTFRFFIEFLKNDQSNFEAGMSLNMGQILSIPMVLCALLLLLRLRKKPKTTFDAVIDSEVSSKLADNKRRI
jgi:phosphatidylglycerol:prolipoprotein diacylglycerol transferase